MCIPIIIIVNIFHIISHSNASSPLRMQIQDERQCVKHFRQQFTALDQTQSKILRCNTCVCSEFCSVYFTYCDALIYQSPIRIFLTCSCSILMLEDRYKRFYSKSCVSEHFCIQIVLDQVPTCGRKKLRLVTQQLMHSLKDK